MFIGISAVFLTAAAIADPYPVDFALTARVQRMANRVGIAKHFVVAVPPQWGELGFVNTRTSVRENIVAITVSPILLEDMDADGQEAMFAHELAHVRLACGWNGYRNETDELTCEHAVDVLSARWVGKRTALRGLCQLLASSWAWRYCTDCHIQIARIRMLHDRRDIE